MNTNFFDEDYYERGLESGKSFYENFRWIPELTIPFAMTMIDFLHIQRHQLILDYGCAKGYLVKAFRLLGREAWGVDISEYALKNVDESVKPFCHLPEKLESLHFDFCIAKDVFEHISVPKLREIMINLNSNKLFAIIPLGENNSYYAMVNNLDKSHIVCETADWWKDFFLSTMCWTLSHFSFRLEGIKDNYVQVPNAYGFFVLERTNTLL
jgi:SAM-dependent methyltransferase